MEFVVTGASNWVLNTPVSGEFVTVREDTGKSEEVYFLNPLLSVGEQVGIHKCL